MPVRVVLTERERAANVDNVTRVLIQLSWVAQKQFAQSVAQHELTFPQYLTLAFLAKSGHPCSMNQVAEATHQDAATMTGVVDRLERLGLVERGRSVQDRRVVLVQPTAQGVALLVAVKQTRDQMMQHLFTTFDDETLKQLNDLLETLWHALETQARNGFCDPPRPST